MSVKKYVWLVYGLLLPSLVAAQPASKKAITHEDVAAWHEISRDQLSDDGRWVTYELVSEVGDPTLVVYDGVTEKEWRYERGTGANISAGSRVLTFTIKPGEEDVKDRKRRGVSRKDLPGDTLGILNLETMELEKMAGLESVQMPDKWEDWLFYQVEAAEPDTASAKKQNDENGYHLQVRSLVDGTTITLPFIKEFVLAERSPAMALVTTGTDDMQAGVYHWQPGADPSLALAGTEEVKQMSLDRNGEQLAFLAYMDTVEHRVTPYDLYHWSTVGGNASTLADDQSDFLPDDWRLSENGRIYFSRNGQRLFFGTAPQPILEDTSLLEEEIVQVEVWTTRDARLYPQQKIQMNRDKRQTYLAMYDITGNRFRQLENLDMPSVMVGDEGNARYALAQNDEPYQIRTSWEGYPPAKDVYLIDLQTGSSKEIVTEMKGYPSLSPAGKYVYWFDYPTNNWHAYTTDSGKRIQLTNNETVAFYDETDDHPDYPGPYGSAGWTTNDDFFLVYDRYDVWQIDPNQKIRAYNLTNGREMKRRSRYVRVDPEERAIEEVSPLLFHFFDVGTKQEGYQQFNIHTGVKEVIEEGPFRYDRRPTKAKNTDQWLFTRESFTTFPNLLYGRTLNSYEQISDANPQQDEFRWGTIELFDFVSLDGAPLQGLLVKPEDFDPNRKYPMIVNFYERSTDGLHRHRAPEFHRSTINYSYYVSKGYVIFNPDVPYKIGYPGESAYNSVMAGVQALLQAGYIDRGHIGVQGHSWGGYQIAHLVTKTNLFKCAESGAPVVNMISAYGGIRWGSGMSRMFQYEHTQSRIGGSLWEKPLLYVENSPIFSIDKIKTPLLILHNDEDGAVPWYQGIEFFVALRRLGKPAWMLNYNGEPHWPLKPQNRRDFQTRMAQFFDHYLMGAPKPEWMETGVPAMEKGIDQHLELMDRH